VVDEASAPDEFSAWPEEQKRAHRLALAERLLRQRRAGQAVALALLAVVGGGIVLRLPEAWWMPLAGAVALGGVVFRLVNWNCPACGERLPGRGAVELCPGCGAPLA
jgi:rubrerythrin